MTPEQLREICREHAITVSLVGLVREADAARILDVAARTLRQWRADGIGPAAVRMGGTWRYPVADLADYMTPAESGEIRQNAAVCAMDGDANAGDALAVRHSRAAQK